MLENLGWKISSFLDDAAFNVSSFFEDTVEMVKDFGNLVDEIKEDTREFKQELRCDLIDIGNSIIPELGSAAATAADIAKLVKIIRL